MVAKRRQSPVAPAPRRYDLVERCLAEYKAMTVEALIAGIPTTEPRRYLYDLVPLYPLRPGKGFRPGLCLATCGAFGGEPTRRPQLGSCVRVVSQRLPRARRRRGRQPHQARPAHAGGRARVGDRRERRRCDERAEHRAAHAESRDAGHDVTWDVFVEIQHMVKQSVEGQAMELGWVRDNVIALGDADYLRMTLKKTCWYTCIHPCRIGALIASRGAIDLDRFNRFGYFMGAAFQIQDDLLNLLGEERNTARRSTATSGKANEP
jgi:geranylgeranyl diphosphate synthase type II